MVASDFDDAPDTFVDSGALPDVESDDALTPRRILCECMAPAMPGGALSTTVAEWARVTSSTACLRGEKWDWCARRGRLSMWLKPTG